MPPQLVLILCDTPVTNRFDFHGKDSQVELDFGDAPAASAVATANIYSSAAGLINAWIDFDHNGAWDMP